MKIHNLLQIALPVTFCFTAITSCKKFTRDQPACYIIAEERPFAEGTDIVINKVMYNDKERTVSYQPTNGQLTTIHYPGEMTITEDEGGRLLKRMFSVNEAGMLTHLRTEYDADGTDWADMTFEYQNNVEIVQSFSATPHAFPAVYKFTWSGGNLQSSVLQAPGEITDVYDYYLDKPSEQGDYFTHRNITSTFGFRVFVSKNLPKSVQSYSSFSSFSYQRDNTGKIISMTTTVDDASFIIKYDYLCNTANYQNK